MGLFGWGGDIDEEDSVGSWNCAFSEALSSLALLYVISPIRLCVDTSA